MPFVLKNSFLANATTAESSGEKRPTGNPYEAQTPKKLKAPSAASLVGLPIAPARFEFWTLRGVRASQVMLESAPKNRPQRLPTTAPPNVVVYPATNCAADMWS